MDYVSTRGRAPAAGFSDVLLAGLAPDGGLYMPSAWPRFAPDEIAAFAAIGHDAAAALILSRFVGGEIGDAALQAMAADAYAGFRPPALAPLRQMAPNDWLLDLANGPTLAFKDYAMMLLARLMDHVLKARRRRMTIAVATSGDTGGAAAHAFGGRDNVDVFVLFPKGRVSPFQQRQMTTTGSDNVHALAVEGSFDDCQRMVKAVLGNRALAERLSLAAVNSINWARIVAQTVYYFTAAAALGAPQRAVSFTVPTGNFGDIFAGYAAQRMGLPIARLVIATNANDILARALDSGRYETHGVVPTSSPSMDIEVSSNFERLLFEAYDRDGDAVRQLMNSLAQSGAFIIADKPLAAIRALFGAGRASEAEVADEIRRTFAAQDLFLDPHTAVARHVAAGFSNPAVPMITLSTAHPAKFPDAVEAATGHRPPLPMGYSDLSERAEVFSVLPNDLAAVQAFIEARARAATKEA